MDTPRVDGLKVLELIGFGGCGRVYRAEDEEGRPVVLKIFDESSVARELLGKMTLRLESGGWPDGVLPVLSAEFAEMPAIRISPLVADTGDDGVALPRSLQHRLDEHPGLESWKLVKSVARALAAMHSRRVPHGNLKPGNVMFDENGDVRLTDWTLGNMPGIQQFHFTDAVLYQPPDQLRDPKNYLEDGCRWDVFAFGVLAFRVLTGKFPRCHDTFELVAPPNGETHRDGLKADLTKVAKNVENQADFTWPDEPRNPLESGYRDWINRCLSLDPAGRPGSMNEVLAGFEAVDAAQTADKERNSLLDQRRRAERRTWTAIFFVGLAAAVAAVLGALWQLSVTRLTKERSAHMGELLTLKTSAEAAARKRSDAESKEKQSDEMLAYERELGLARLEASRQIGDRLFDWGMEKGHRSLPPLDGRDLRLKRLERYYQDFLTRTAEIASLADERARAKLQLAEISISSGDAKEAAKRLAEALQAWSSLPMDADLKMRIARNSLWLALLRQSHSDPETGAAFAAARKAFAEVPREEVDTDRLDQLMAIMDYHEANLLASTGRDTRALEQLMRATQTLNRISDQRPDAVILRSELAACYLSSATILEGIGSLGDAREVRMLATAELNRLLKEKPNDPGLRMDLAGCYGAMAEASVLSGDVAGAEQVSSEALRLLNGILTEQPDNAEAQSRKAAQLGLRAGILRDRGQSAEAIQNFDEGIRMLEGLRASYRDNAMATYRLALLWWQKGRMLGMAGNRGEEISLISKGRDVLENLEAAGSLSGPRPEQLQRSNAYLLGDLGHALQLAGRKDESRKAFGDAVVLWETLQRSRPQSEEYSEGLTWCRQRLQDLK